MSRSGSIQLAMNQRAMKKKKSLARRPAELFAVMFAACLLTLALTLPFQALSLKPLRAKANEDLPAGPMQAKATTACLECHEARIILQQRLSKAAWAREVDKMVKWGAVVETADHDSLIDYLSANFGPDQPAYEPPRTAAQKPGAKK
jgi:hypothetical protein